MDVSLTLWVLTIAGLAALIAVDFFIGRKPHADYEDATPATVLDRPLPRATLCLVAATVIVFGTIWMVGGKL